MDRTETRLAQQEWNRFRVWAETASPSQRNHRLKELVRTNPVALRAWQDTEARLYGNGYTSTSFWSRDPGGPIESTGSGKTMPFSGLHKDQSFMDKTDILWVIRSRNLRGARA
jgi:hypothetical protein